MNRGYWEFRLKFTLRSTRVDYVALACHSDYPRQRPLKTSYDKALAASCKSNRFRDRKSCAVTLYYSLDASSGAWSLDPPSAQPCKVQASGWLGFWVIPKFGLFRAYAGQFRRESARG